MKLWFNICYRLIKCIFSTKQLIKRKLRMGEITFFMTQMCYEKAKAIYPHSEMINDVAKHISSEINMNVGSARDYITDFFLMRNGEPLKHAMSESAAKYYFECIYNDFGEDALTSALDSLQFYLNYDKQNHPGLQDLINRFRENK